MALNTQSFSALVTTWATAAQGACSKLVDFTVGSILRAIDEATAFVALWLQGLALQVAALTRAATSNGSDLDSWFAQFGFARLPASTATMLETFGRFTPTNQALIYPGSQVQSQDGTVVFQVVADVTNPAWNATLGAYVLPPGTASINATVQCATAGTAGNVSANTITALATAISGVDYVANPNPAANGIDAESDAAARSRFVLFIASLEQATLLAVKNAIAGVQQGLTYTIAENQQYNGQTQNGYFTAVVNDGSGAPPTQTLNNVANAIDAIRPLCSTFGVHGPVVLTANVGMTLATSGDHLHANVVAAVIAALQAYINGLTIGQSLPYSILSSIAYGVPGVVNVTTITLNAGTADLLANEQQTILPGTMTVL